LKLVVGLANVTQAMEAVLLDAEHRLVLLDSVGMLVLLDALEPVARRIVSSAISAVSEVRVGIGGEIGLGRSVAVEAPVELLAEVA
jgi:hypothetical protein